MKWTLLTLLGFGDVATASTAPGQPCTPGDVTISCPTKTLNVQTNFDNLDVDPTIEQSYRHLSYSNLTVQAGHRARGIIPHSKPKYALSGPYPRPLTAAPSWPIDGTSTTSFDMNGMWVGCLNANNTKNGYAATKCQFTVDCVTPFDGGS
ncbi:hypothetical protein MMC28_011106 [Mycoblastus sanguinarius]|nr:hypothetical protein [Mycoblastus sanguinarius]